MFGFTGSTLAVSVNPFVNGFDWWGFILMGLAIALVAVVFGLIAWPVVGFFSSDRLLVEDSAHRVPQFCHGRRLNGVARGELVGMAVFLVALAFGGSLLVHTERVDHADAIAVSESNAADQVAQLEDDIEAANEATDDANQAAATAIAGQYEQWLGLLGYDRVEDIDTEAQTATVVFPFCRRVVSMAGEFPAFVLDDDGAGNVTVTEVQHRLILEQIVAADPDHPFRACFGESDLARVPGYVPA